MKQMHRDQKQMTVETFALMYSFLFNIQTQLSIFSIFTKEVNMQLSYFCYPIRSSCSDQSLFSENNTAGSFCHNIFLLVTKQ
jgi:hypothetical protein